MASTSQPVPNFGVRFCNELDSKKNCICSPISVETLMALVALGSSGDTRAELLTALNIRDDDTIRSTFTTLTQTLDLSSNTSPSSSDKRDVILKIANKIYVKNRGTLIPKLEKDAVKVFKSNLEQIDFNESSAAANMINDWVENQTNNIIQNIVSPSMFDKNTALLLVNAIYFHGFWEKPFRAYNTRLTDFHVNNTTNVRMDMMINKGASFDYKYCPELKAKILRMFYEGGEASMVMVLPDEIEGLSDVMQCLTAGYKLTEDIKSLEKTRLKVVIPKFKVETEINLKELLSKMGIQTIFDENKSDINMLTSNDRLYVSEAIQKAYIVVDEKGTEATAATVWRVNKKSICRAEENFIADHPYFYLLTVREIPIFYGTFYGNIDSDSHQNLTRQDGSLLTEFEDTSII